MGPEYDVRGFTDRDVHRVNRTCVGDLAARLAWTYPDREAAVAGEPAAAAYADHARLTYEELDTLANQVANAFLDVGLTAGDRVFTYCKNSTEYLAVQLGLAKTELVAVAGNPMFPNDVLSHIIQESEPAVALVDSDAYASDSELFQNGAPEVLTYLPSGDDIEGLPEFDSFLEPHGSNEPTADIQPTDVFEIMYTSGTTGPAKGAMITHQYMYTTCAANVMRQLRGTPPLIDIIGGTFYPLAHIGQCHPFSNLMAQGKTVLLRNPTPETVATAISEEEINCVNVISPYMMSQLAERVETEPDSYSFDSLEFVMWGFGSLDPQIRDRFQDVIDGDVIFDISNGQTESVLDTNFYTAENEEKYVENSPETNYFGEPAPLFSVVALGEDGKVMPPGEEGFFEKAMRSPATMEGYFRQPEETAKTFRDDWLHSGDGGFVDADGHFVFTGRLRDIIKSGGENVAAERVEGAVRSHPKVDDVAAIGLPHERWLEAVTVVVVPRAGQDITEAEVLDYCRSDNTPLASFEVPKDVIFVDELPRSVGDKVKKFQLEEQYGDYYE